jgi:ribosomal protein S12 methylthiotransferase accessory factor
LDEVQGAAVGKPHLMPAQLAQYPFRLHVPDEPILNPLTSNGMAGHFSRDEAILAGLKELIQRDAFLIYWLNNLTPRHIDVSGIVDPQFQRLLAYARAYRTDLYFLDLETDLPVPTAVCIP